MIYTIISIFLRDCVLHYFLGTDCQIYHQRRMRRQQLVIFPQIFLSSSFLPSEDKSMKNVLSLTFHICFSKGRGSRKEDDMWSKKTLGECFCNLSLHQILYPIIIGTREIYLVFQIYHEQDIIYLLAASKLLKILEHIVLDKDHIPLHDERERS